MKKSTVIPLLLSISLSALTFQANAKNLTNYVTEWSGYGGNGQYPAYPFDGAYENGYHNTQKSTNSDMVAKVQNSNVVAYAFLQVWNPSSATSQKFNVPADWAGHLHFDDVWGNLPSSVVPEYPTWKTFCSAVDAGGCATVQQDCSTGSCHLALLDFNKTDIGQMNNFGAFTTMNKGGQTKKIIAIGGANTPDNGSVSTETYQAIFTHQNAFLISLSSWLNQLRTMDPNFYGVDYDFEPPITPDGGQIKPNASTATDYKNLFALVKATRATLGKDAYISVTITSNEDYLAAINSSVDGGWFKTIAPYVNAINIMTYDMHGPWSNADDPGTLPHSPLRMPNNIQHTYSIQYGAEDVLDQVLGYGVPANKLQIGIAAYGRGFSGVESGTNGLYPGFDQTWTGASHFEASYSNQDGLLPYKSISNVINDKGYTNYDITDNQGNTLASYIYNVKDKQFVGYESPAEVKSLCRYIKAKGLQGAILWSMDTDTALNSNNSLNQTFKSVCQ